MLFEGTAGNDRQILLMLPHHERRRQDTGKLIKELSSLRYRTAELEALQQAGGSTRVSGIYTELLGAGIEERAAELNAFNDQLLRKVEELKQKEEEIREVRDFLMNMFNTALEGFIVTDSQGSITMANETALRILGFPRGELVGKNTIELRPEGEEYQEKGKELIEKLFEDGFIKGVERTWRRKDGSLAELETNMVLLRDKAGNVKGSLASLRDITERKRAREKLIAYHMQPDPWHPSWHWLKGGHAAHRQRRLKSGDSRPTSPIR